MRVLVQALLRVDLTFAPSLNVNVSSDVCACVYLSRCRVSRRALRAACFVNVIVLTTQSACHSVTPPSYSGTLIWHRARWACAHPGHKEERNQK